MDTPLTTLGALARILRSEGERRFLSRYPAAVLLVSPIGGLPARIYTPPSGNLKEWSEGTIALDPMSEAASARQTQRRPRPGSSPPPAPPFDASHVVIRLIKSDRNPFSNVITVGRARSNDIVIESPEVSKVHAYVRSRGEEWSVSDNGSTNGTFIESIRLTPKEETTLAAGMAIRFGPVCCRLVSPAELVDCCAAVAPGV